MTTGHRWATGARSLIRSIRCSHPMIRYGEAHPHRPERRPEPVEGPVEGLTTIRPAPNSASGRGLG